MIDFAHSDESFSFSFFFLSSRQFGSPAPTPPPTPRSLMFIRVICACLLYQQRPDCHFLWFVALQTRLCVTGEMSLLYIKQFVCLGESISIVLHFQSFQHIPALVLFPRRLRCSTLTREGKKSVEINHRARKQTVYGSLVSGLCTLKHSPFFFSFSFFKVWLEDWIMQSIQLKTLWCNTKGYDNLFVDCSSCNIVHALQPH